MFNLASTIRPFFGAVVLTAGLLTAAGIYSATRMPSGVYPEVTFPRIAVVARKPGIDLRNMELQVTVPLEQAVSTVAGVERVRSKTIRGGSELSIDFTPGTDMKRAEQLTWNRIGAIRSQMPPDVEFTVEQMTPSVFPILSVVLTTDDTSPRAAADLRDYAYYQLAPQIKNVPDVLYCNVAGGDVREIAVVARPDDLLAAGLSAADLADRIGKTYRVAPVGRIEKPPFAFQIIIDTQGQAGGPEGSRTYQIEELVIGSKGHQPLRVRDVADVSIGHADRTQSVGFQGKDAVVLTVFRRLGGNTVGISRDVGDLLGRQPPPRGIRATVAYDQARFVNTAVDNVRDAILVGGLFSVLILLAFLRSWRATLISALAIPVTLCITFLFLYWSGETFNLMSLGGLAVAIGLIIDDTVVVIENIARHLTPLTPPPPLPQGGEGGQANDLSPPSPPGGRGAGGEGAAADPVAAASGEITGAVVGSTLTTVLVFVPLAFITGVYGQFFASLSVALSVAVLVSMVISLTLVPVFAAKFLAGRPMPEPGPVYRAVAHVYDLGLAVALRFPWVTLSLSLAAVGVGVLLYAGLPDPRPAPAGQPRQVLVKGLETGLMPQMDEGAFVLDYWAPTGTPLARTEEMARELEHILSENPDVQAYVRRTGAELGLFATQSNRGDIQVVLRPAENDPVSLARKPVRPKFSDVEAEIKRDGMEAVRTKYRRRPLQDIMGEIEDDIKEHFTENQLRFELVQVMQDELNDLSGANRPVEVKIFGPDHMKLRDLADKVAETLEKKGKGRGLKGVNSNVYAGNPDLLVKVDGDRAARAGLSPDEIERQLHAVYLGQEATRVPESDLRVTPVRVRYPDAVRYGPGRFDPDLARELRLLVPEGTFVPDPRRLAGPARAVRLADVAAVRPVRTPDERSRENQQPAVFVTAELNEGEAGLGSVVRDINGWMGEMKDEVPAGYRWELGGHYVKQQQAFHSLGVVMAVAVLLVYIMLAFQFRSAVLPLLIFATQPLSLVSGLFALWLTHTPLNVSSYMGAVLLIGLDMKNGILLVEYIQQLRKEGMALRPALLLAGRTRFRPILMTSLAAVLGLLPLALGIGPGAQMQQPLAIMVIGGLTANMLFTRMVIPVGYLVLERRAAQGDRSPAPPA
jgi:multidrug efflux pump subunit AcrB